jgi:hypothetical protein
MKAAQEEGCRIEAIPSKHARFAVLDRIIPSLPSSVKRLGCVTLGVSFR